MADALIALGSNLGDRKSHMDFAVASLSAAPDVELLTVSSYHETAPAGGPAGQGSFLNAAAQLRTSLPPHDLLAFLHRIEADAGRVRNEHWAARTLDLDLLQYDDLAIHDPILEIPHPRIAVRRFVLAPLVEILSYGIHRSTGHPFASLLANLDRRPGVVQVGQLLGNTREMAERVARAVGGDSLCDANKRGIHGWKRRAAEPPEVFLARVVEVLSPDRWTHLGDRWLITDLWPGDAMGDFLDGYPDHITGLADSLRLRQSIEDAKTKILSPTFLVTSRPSPERPLAELLRSPATPFLRVCHGPPQAVADEIIAACLAARS